MLCSATRQVALGIVALTIGCAPAPRATAPTAPFRAIGTEPFWGLQITTDGLRFTTPDDPAGRSFPPVEPAAAGDTLHWVAEAAGVTLDARIWPGECSDNMSDKVWSHTAAVQLGGTAYRGCAEARAAPEPGGDEPGGDE
jgi:uncharacterized membrane protein